MKKLFILLISTILIFTLVGCNASKNSEENSNTTDDAVLQDDVSFDITEGKITHETNSENSEEQTHTEVAIPDWYIENGVAVKGNQLCFSRNDGLIMAGGVEPTTIRVFTANSDNIIIDVTEYIILDNEDQAKKYSAELNTYENGTNSFGMEKGQSSYSYKNNILIESYDESYYQDIENIYTLEDAINQYIAYGWEINYLDDADSAEAAEDELTSLVESYIEQSENLPTPSEMVSQLEFLDAFEEYTVIFENLGKLATENADNVFVVRAFTNHVNQIPSWTNAYDALTSEIDPSDSATRAENIEYIDRYTELLGRLEIVLEAYQEAI